MQSIRSARSRTSPQRTPRGSPLCCVHPRRSPSTLPSAVRILTATGPSTPASPKKASGSQTGNNQKEYPKIKISSTAPAAATVSAPQVTVAAKQFSLTTNSATGFPSESAKSAKRRKKRCSEGSYYCSSDKEMVSKSLYVHLF